jgi:hypothetical protein
LVTLLLDRLFPQSSSASRFTAGAFGFLTFNHKGDRFNRRKMEDQRREAAETPLPAALDGRGTAEGETILGEF